MNWNLLNEIEEKTCLLNAEERLYLIEKLARQVRSEQFTNHDRIRKGLEAMAANPQIQEDLELWRTAKAL